MPAENQCRIERDGQSVAGNRIDESCRVTDQHHAIRGSARRATRHRTRSPDCGNCRRIAESCLKLWKTARECRDRRLLDEAILPREIYADAMIRYRRHDALARPVDVHFDMVGPWADSVMLTKSESAA